jgi:hypothetical protein
MKWSPHGVSRSLGSLSKAAPRGGAHSLVTVLFEVFFIAIIMQDHLRVAGG